MPAEVPAATACPTSTSACRRASPKTNGSRPPKCSRATAQVVHHTIVYVEPPGGKRSARLDVSFGVRSRLAAAQPLPEGAAKRIPAGSTLVFEMHYTPNGSAQQDKTQIGLLFADVDKIDKEVITCEIGNIDFEIPPGDDNHVVTGTSRPTKQEVTLLSLSPHMHLRGKAFRYELVLPTGEREVLLDVPAYDFNWQTRYVLAEPRMLPAGSVIYCRAAFDNSEDEPRESRPDENGALGRSVVGRNDARLLRRDPAARRSAKAGQQTRRPGLDVVGMFDVGDADHNGGLSKDEASANELLTQHFATIDTSGDEELQLGEILAAIRALESRR